MEIEKAGHLTASLASVCAYGLTHLHACAHTCTIHTSVLVRMVCIQLCHLINEIKCLNYILLHLLYLCGLYIKRSSKRLLCRWFVAASGFYQRWLVLARQGLLGGSYILPWSFFFFKEILEHKLLPLSLPHLLPGLPKVSNFCASVVFALVCYAPKQQSQSTTCWSHWDCDSKHFLLYLGLSKVICHSSGKLWQTELPRYFKIQAQCLNRYRIVPH